ncbi:MAG: MMPL family transporter [Bacteriovoracaceae bacterium]|nr:MMPL family transporter [Bacteriovoracaceae bacterium]
MDRFLNYNRFSVWVVLIVTAFLFVPFLNTKIDNSLKVVYEQGGPQDLVNKEIKKDFGNLDELGVLAYRSDDLFTIEELKFIKELQKELELIEGVKSCYSIVNISHFWKSVVDGEETTNSGKFLSKIPVNPEELLELKKRALKNPLYEKSLISRDGNTAGFNIVLENNLSSEEKALATQNIMKLYKSKNRSDRFYFTGMHAFMDFNGRFIKKDIAFYTVLLIVVMFIVLTVLFKSVPITIAILLTAGICNILTIGAGSLFGLRLTLATSGVPAIVSALCIAYTVHIFCSNKEMMKEALVSNLLAAGTSMLGFSTMIINPLQTIRDLGIFLTMGAFFAVFVSTLFAIQVKQNYFEKIKENETVTEITSWLNNFVKNNGWPIYLISFLFFAISPFIFKMEIDTNYYGYFKKKVEIVRHVDFVNKNISGQYPIVVKLTKPGGIKDKNVLTFIEEFTEHIKKVPGVDKIVSYNSILDEGQKAFVDKLERGWFKDLQAVEETTMLLEGEDEDMLRYYLSLDEKSTLIFIRTNVISTRGFKRIIKEVENYTKKNSLDDTNVLIGGTYLNIVKSTDKMSRMQLISTMFAVLAILLVVFLFVRNLKLMIYAGIANILPVVAIYGILGIVGESINMGTAIVAAIAFGLAVDDTIHFITRFKYSYERTGDVDVSIQEVFQRGIKSIIFTSVVIGAGFLTMALSSFVPIYQLGLYTAITMILCLLADALLLPRMIHDTKKGFGKN